MAKRKAYNVLFRQRLQLSYNWPRVSRPVSLKVASHRLQCVPSSVDFVALFTLPLFRPVSLSLIDRH